MAERTKKQNREANKTGAQRFPTSKEVENQLLGNFINYPVEFKKYASELTPEHFYVPMNTKIFLAMSELVKTGSVDLISIQDYFKLHYPEEENIMEYLVGLMTSVLYSSQYKEHIDILKRDMILRDINEVGKKIVDASLTSDDHNSCLAYAETLLLEVSQRTSRSNSLVTLTQASSDYLTKLEQLVVDRDIFKGLRTGFNALDYSIDGLRAGNLLILAARPSVGKSSFAMNIVSNIIERNKSKDKVIVVYSLEMPAEQIVQRLMAIMSNVTMKNIFSGEVSQNAYEEIFNVHSKFDNCHVYIDDSSMQTPNNIWAQCRKLKILHKKIDLIIVDYLQLLSYSDPTQPNRRVEMNETTEVTRNSRMLKKIAMEMGCPVLALSQLSRSIDGRESKEGVTKVPKLSDLRQSGAIEQDADVVMFLAREKDAGEKGKGYIILAIEKNRNGPLNKIMYQWDGDHVRFIEDLEKSVPMTD